MSHRLKNLSRGKGYAPGSLKSRTETIPGGNMPLQVITYDPDKITEKEIQISTTIEQLREYRDNKSITWINLNDVRCVDWVEKIGEAFDIHPLILEDIVNANQRPKNEEMDNYLFIAVKMLTYNEPQEFIDAEQVSFILTGSCVLTFQEKPGDVFEPVRERIRTGKGRIRRMGSDYLAYSLLDMLIDNYFLVMEKIGDRVEDLDEDLLTSIDNKHLKMLHHLKREIIFMRKSVWPLRETIGDLYRGEKAIIGKETSVYFGDLYDHTIQVIDTVEGLRDMVSGMLDTYLSQLGNKMNEVMKVLTIIATIFIPLTFIAGIYGMNFEFMPELKWKSGYFVTLSLMLIIALGMVLYFRRKKWL